MATGQCKIDPVTGISGVIYNAWTGDSDAGLSPGVTVSGSTLRKLLGAQIEAIAGAITSGTSTPTAWASQSKSADFTAAAWTHYEVDTTGGNVACTLPAATAGVFLSVTKTVAANRITFAGGSIDGDGSAYLDATDTITLFGLGGTSWRWIS